MTDEVASTSWRRFLEATPPNSPVTVPALVRRSQNQYGAERLSIPSPLIALHCEHDGGSRVFVADAAVYLNAPPHFEFISYKCRNCEVTTKTFAVVVDWEPNGNAKVMKLGEFPPFSAPISSRIRKLLSDADLELYRKGTRATAQGLGIGAASYFRRIVEDQWKRLVAEIQSAAEQLGDEDLGVYDAALKETQFSSAVERLKGAIPEKLLILDGRNPLILLHRPLSQQLHGLTDEQCLQQATDIRIVLTALLENIAEVLKKQDELRAAANRLQNG